MGRTALVTVPDEGAAWVVRDALAAGGVTCEVERVGLENPYSANALARQMRIFVADEQLVEARRLLAALEGELASDEDDLAAEAVGAGRLAEEAEAAETAATAPQRTPKLGTGLALALLPLPVVSFYAGIRWLGLIFFVVFLVGLTYAMPELEDLDLWSALTSWPYGVLLPGAKLADLVVGIALLVAQRRPRAT